MYSVRKIISILLLLVSLSANSQSIPSDTLNAQQTAVHTPSYSEVKGYVGILVPIYTFSTDGNTANGQNNFIIGNPWGINLWKSKRFGFSFEITPLLKINNHESKVSNIMFHPGVLYRIGHEYTFIGRVAYETSGRYGITPIINKVVKRTASNTFFIALTFPVRFGNNLAPSFTTAFQFGIGF